jgi:hypothetical protein
MKTGQGGRAARSKPLRLVGRRVLAVRTRRVSTNGGPVNEVERIDLDGLSLRLMVHEREETSRNGPYAVSLLPMDVAASEAVDPGGHESVTICVGSRTFIVTAAQWRQVVSAMNMVDAGEPDPACGYQRKPFAAAFDAVMKVRDLLVEVDGLLEHDAAAKGTVTP